MKYKFSYSKKGNQFFPIIDLILKGPKDILKAKALIDSGASFSVFRSEIADYLGINIEKGKQMYLEGIGGRILGYLHTLSVFIGKKVYKCKIIFSREFNVSFNLLGRDNFFLPFIISFHERDKRVIVEEL